MKNDLYFKFLHAGNSQSLQKIIHNTPTANTQRTIEAVCTAFILLTNWIDVNIAHPSCSVTNNQSGVDSDIMLFYCQQAG